MLFYTMVAGLGAVANAASKDYTFYPIPKGAKNTTDGYRMIALVEIGTQVRG